MALPTEPDYALLLRGDVLVCGITGVSVGSTANTSETFRRDCEAPNQIATSVIKVTGKSQTVEGSGIIDVDQLPFFLGAIGYRDAYSIELYENIAPDNEGVAPAQGTLLGTLSGTYLLSASNLSVSQDADSTGSVTLLNSGGWTYTPAVAP